MTRAADGGSGGPAGDAEPRLAGDGGEPDAAEPGPECPFCGSTDTEPESSFGTEVSAEQHYCNGCHTVFERIKYDGASADAGRDAEGG